MVLSVSNRTFDRWLEQRIAIAVLEARVRNEKAAYQAMKALGLRANLEGVREAEKRMAEQSPLYVKTIVLRGRLCRDMYDEHPGHTYYYSDAEETFDAPAYCPLTKAMVLSLQLLWNAQKEAEGEDEHDGLFFPASIVLLDQFNNPLQEYSQRHLGGGQYAESWLTEFPGEAEWASIEEKASTLDSEGCLEARWDNFETARGLRAEAASLRRRIQIAKSSLRVLT